MVKWSELINIIPSKVQIKKKVFYEVLWTEEFNNKEIVGETRFNSRQIVIKRKQSPKNIIITYLHELAHAYSKEHSINLTETQILSLENCLYFLLKNGNIFKGINYERTRSRKTRNLKTVRRVNKKTSQGTNR